ncbi:glycosyltransferase family 4 protein [Methanosarcina mazei]|uniref:Glycosyl transferase n=2 Tax=Methanosarcina mazei TaxID=2209 RepID=A0A0F8MXN5_METMZ|nr:glycosyltransferase family 4 protein [Methanosarcina mazei]AKB65772.1 Glycosyltransferase [Methanosarcina mazei S-6]KKH33450.1 glycosyl transferase [Methanosarcina mazei]
MEDSSQNICLLSVCDATPNSFGSFEEFLVTLSEKLKQDGWMHVIIFRERPIEEVEKSLLNQNAQIRIMKPSKLGIINFVQLYQIIKEIQPNYVHFHFYPIFSVVNYLSFLFNIKIIYTDHMGSRKPKSTFKKIMRKPYYFTYSKLYSCGIEKVVCVSEFVKLKYFKEYGINPKKMCVIHNGINTIRFQKKSDIKEIREKYNLKEKIIVTCIGLRFDKGPHCLIKAAPLILQKIPNIKFVLVGGGDFRDYLEKLIEDQKIKDHVLITGIVTDVTDIYNISSCVVVPSVCEEAFCFIVAEAMAMEIPVVAFDSGAIKEVVHNESQIVPKNYTLLADRVVEVLSEEDDIFRKKEMRNHIIENFPLEKCVNEYFQLYKNISQNKK